MFRQLRILILLLILLGVAVNSCQKERRISAWTSTVHVVAYPINGDGSAASEAYVKSLTQESFSPVEDYLQEEADRYGLSLIKPVAITLGPVMRIMPPPMPERPSVLNNVLWSLRLRWWAWRHTPSASIPPTVRMYLLYFNPQDTDLVPDSVGLKQGLVSIVNLYASRRQAGSNRVVMTHELLHTFGATDKYDYANNQPVFPFGYGEPEKNPRYPQHFAEIMGGRVALSPTEARIPVSLSETLIGPATAIEIGWNKKEQ